MISLIFPMTRLELCDLGREISEVKYYMHRNISRVPTINMAHHSWCCTSSSGRSGVCQDSLPPSLPSLLFVSKLQCAGPKLTSERLCFISLRMEYPHKCFGIFFMRDLSTSPICLCVHLFISVKTYCRL